MDRQVEFLRRSIMDWKGELDQVDDNPQARKVRQGKKGSYKTEFAPGDIEYIESYIDNQLDDYYSFYKTPAA